MVYTYPDADMFRLCVVTRKRRKPVFAKMPQRFGCLDGKVGSLLELLANKSQYIS